MKRKANVRRSRDVPASGISETAVELSSAPATQGRSSIESVDEHKTASIEFVPQTGPESGVAGFIEPDAADAGGDRLPQAHPER